MEFCYSSLFSPLHESRIDDSGDGSSSTNGQGGLTFDSKNCVFNSDISTKNYIRFSRDGLLAPNYNSKSYENGFGESENGKGIFLINLAHVNARFRLLRLHLVSEMLQKIFKYILKILT